MQSLSIVKTAMSPPLSNKPVGRSIYTKVKQQKAFLERKQDIEKPEPVKDVYGNTSVTKINSETHSKVVLSKETIKQLMEYDRKDEWTLVTDSFDEIIVRLLHQCQKKKKRRD